MKLLFIHQNFPGQFKHLAPALAAAGEVYTLTGIGTDGADPLSVLIDDTEHQFTV